VLPGEITQKSLGMSGVSPTMVPPGTPSKAAYERAEPGTLVIVFNAAPVTALNLQINVQHDPAYSMMFANILTDQPWYPNDDTLIHAIAFKSAEYHDGKDAATTTGYMQALSTMIRNDKLKFGVIENFDMPLSRNWKKR
jgi:hypothetical protein